VDRFNARRQITENRGQKVKDIEQKTIMPPP
jgi:hypothetical protein